MPETTTPRERSRAIPASPPPLFTDNAGRVCCSKHTPAKGSDTWNWGQWREMTPAERLEYRAAGLEACEECEECEEYPDDPMEAQRWQDELAEQEDAEQEAKGSGEVCGHIIRELAQD